MKLDSLWYDGSPLALLLLPAAWVFCAGVKLRRQAYRHGLLKSHRLDVPLIVAGNLTVGGTGKTPLVIWLAAFLKAHGFNPGVVTRGYKGQARDWPQRVHAGSDPRLVGDEPVVIARRAGVPVMAGPDRVAACHVLREQHACDVIVSDDGLQHYAMRRDIEIAVVDDIRRFGNGLCLPAGPLREPEERLQEVRFVVTKGAAMPHEISMKYHMEALRQVADETLVQPLTNFRGQSVHAVAGIGDPDRFFGRLEEQGIKVKRHAFPDHYFYTARDLEFGDDLPVLMTEKDAVKCRGITDARHWYVPLEAQLPQSFGEALLSLLPPRRRPPMEFENGQKAA